MTEVELILALLVAVAVLVSLAARLGIPSPILLVLGGAGLGLIPALPRIEIAPDIVFLLFVPPLVFVAGFFASWRDFVANARPILSLAVGSVLASAFVVGAVAHLVIGIPWAPALVLGAVVSNTDTAAIIAIAQQTDLPRRITTVLEGEGLFNDAVALTAFRLAIAATVTGTYSAWEGGTRFVVAVIGAVAIGGLVGWLTAAARLRSGDPRVIIIIGIVTPYAAYLAADQVGASGILAVVIAGLYLGRREPHFEDAATRVQARAVWDVIVFILNGLLFILVGFQLRSIWDALQFDDLQEILGAAAAICLAVILTRIVWVAVTTAVPPHWGGTRPGSVKGDWRDAAVLSWAGLRGGETLAAALSVPLLTDRGAPFPFRAEIIFLAFTVIIVTLVGQGLTLPLVIHRLRVTIDDSEEHEEVLARRAAVAAALERLDTLEREQPEPSHMLDGLRKHFEHEAALQQAQSDAPERVAKHVAGELRLRREVLQAEEAAVEQLRDEGVISDQVLRRVQRELDLEQTRFDPR